MKRSAALVKVTILAVALGSIAVGGLAVYFYTLPPASASAGGTPPAAIGQVVTNQVSSGHSITVEYNGTSYSVPAKGANSPSFACPQGTDPSLCALLQETCGNGVGSGQEPWKTCYQLRLRRGLRWRQQLRPLHPRVLFSCLGVHGDRGRLQPGRLARLEGHSRLCRFPRILCLV